MALFCEFCGNENLDFASFCSRCGSAIKGIPSQGRLLPAGLVLNACYEITELVHAGSKGALYRARNSSTGRGHFVKELICPEGASVKGETLESRFEKEAAALTALKLEKLPAITDHFTTMQRYYLVTELTEGKDLKTLLEEQGSQGLPEKWVLHLAIEILTVLDHCDRFLAGLLDFTVLPGTVIVTSGGSPVLVDFTLALITGATGNEAAHVRAVGALMYTLLTGVDPEDSLSLASPDPLGRFVTSVASIETLSPSLTPELKGAVMRALEPDPSWAFPSPLEFQETLITIEMNEHPQLATLEKQEQKRSKMLKTREIRGGGKKLWAFPAGGPILSSPGVGGGFVYFGSFDGHLYCLDASSGALAWKYRTGARIISSPCVFEGAVYCGSEDLRLHCVEALSGRKKWSFDARSFVNSSPLAGKGFLYAAAQDGHLYCLDAEKGTVRWKYKTRTMTDGSPCIEGSRLFLGDKKYFYVLDSRSGSLIREEEIGDSANSSPLYYRGLIYLACTMSGLRCINPDSGTTLWNFKDSNAWITMWNDASPCADESRVFFGSRDGRLYCLDGQRGSLLWEFRTRGKVTSSPCCAGGYLFFGCDDRHLYCIETEEGREIWKLLTENMVRSSPSVADGLVYCGSNDGKLYCIDSGTRGISAPNSVSRQK
ncbi:MAG: PQQ-binding-like beta-propeller repeat protein [Candidatus Eremiobacteraeota bacterium]|nr:PQQ-binding-like beta-propeller repeat protein [Candidatus Eremiobacteraeota bacterium]